jgi:hypothetical protein
MGRFINLDTGAVVEMDARKSNGAKVLGHIRLADLLNIPATPPAAPVSAPIPPRAAAPQAVAAQALEAWATRPASSNSRKPRKMTPDMVHAADYAADNPMSGKHFAPCPMDSCRHSANRGQPSGFKLRPDRPELLGTLEFSCGHSVNYKR